MVVMHMVVPGVMVVPVAMIVVNQQGAITRVNQLAETTFGYESHELIGQPVETLIPERYRNHHPHFRRGFLAEATARPMGSEGVARGLRDGQGRSVASLIARARRLRDGRQFLNATKAAELLARVGLDENPETILDDLGLGKQQLVEIAKALSKNVRLLILDEPTSSLNEDDSAKLLDLLMDFREKGLTSILISHKLNEVSKVADTITVLRDGATVARMNCADGVDENDIVRNMVGRALEVYKTGADRRLHNAAERLTPAGIQRQSAQQRSLGRRSRSAERDA